MSDSERNRDDSDEDSRGQKESTSSTNGPSPTKQSEQTTNGDTRQQETSVSEMSSSDSDIDDELKLLNARTQDQPQSTGLPSTSEAVGISQFSEEEQRIKAVEENRRLMLESDARRALDMPSLAEDEDDDEDPSTGCIPNISVEHIIKPTPTKRSLGFAKGYLLVGRRYTPPQVRPVTGRYSNIQLPYSKQADEQVVPQASEEPTQLVALDTQAPPTSHSGHQMQQGEKVQEQPQTSQISPRGKKRHHSHPTPSAELAHVSGLCKQRSSEFKSQAPTLEPNMEDQKTESSVMVETLGSTNTLSSDTSESPTSDLTQSKRPKFNETILPEEASTSTTRIQPSSDSESPMTSTSSPRIGTGSDDDNLSDEMAQLELQPSNVESPTEEGQLATEHEASTDLRQSPLRQRTRLFPQEQTAHRDQLSTVARGDQSETSTSSAASSSSSVDTLPLAIRQLISPPGFDISSPGGAGTDSIPTRSPTTASTHTTSSGLHYYDHPPRPMLNPEDRWSSPTRRLIRARFREPVLELIRHRLAQVRARQAEPSNVPQAQPGTSRGGGQFYAGPGLYHNMLLYRRWGPQIPYSLFLGQNTLLRGTNPYLRNGIVRRPMGARYRPPPFAPSHYPFRQWSPMRTSSPMARAPTAADLGQSTSSESTEPDSTQPDESRSHEGIETLRISDEDGERAEPGPSQTSREATLEASDLNVSTTSKDTDGDVTSVQWTTAQHLETTESEARLPRSSSSSSSEEL